MPLQASDGTASNPSITNIGDTNTGIYFPAEDTISLVEGGTEVLRLTSTRGIEHYLANPTPVAGDNRTYYRHSRIGFVSDFKAGYLLLARVDTGILAQPTEFTGWVYVRRGSSGSSNVNLNQFVSIRRAYDSVRVEHNGPFSLVTLTYGGVDYYALDFSFRGDSGVVVGIEGYFQNMTPVLIDANNNEAGVTNVTPYQSSIWVRPLGGQGLIYYTNGSERMRITNEGNVGIGTNSPTRSLDVRGQGYFQNGLVVSDGSAVNPPSQSLLHLRRSNRNNGISWNDTSFAYACFIQTTAGVLELGGRQNSTTNADNTDPQIRIYDRGVDFPSISTTASGANAFLSGTTRRLLVSTSSLRYKKDIEPVEETYADAILDLQAVYYRSKSLVDNPDWSWWGFVAEDVFKVDPRLVTYIEDPEDPDKLIPDGVQYDRIAVLLQDVVRRQSLKISELEQRIYSLEQQVIS